MDLKKEMIAGQGLFDTYFSKSFHYGIRICHAPSPIVGSLNYREISDTMFTIYRYTKVTCFIFNKCMITERKRKMYEWRKSKRFMTKTRKS